MLDKKAFAKWLQARPRLNVATTNASTTFSQDPPNVTSEPDISLEIAKQTIVGQAAQLIQQAQELEQQEQLLEQLRSLTNNGLLSNFQADVRFASNVGRILAESS